MGRVRPRKSNPLHLQRRSQVAKCRRPSPGHVRSPRGRCHLPPRGRSIRHLSPARRPCRRGRCLPVQGNRAGPGLSAGKWNSRRRAPVLQTPPPPPPPPHCSVRNLSVGEARCIISVCNAWSLLTFTRKRIKAESKVNDFVSEGETLGRRFWTKSHHSKAILPTTSNQMMHKSVGSRLRLMDFWFKFKLIYINICILNNIEKILIMQNLTTPQY